jgi:hypothetical protein
MFRSDPDPAVHRTATHYRNLRFGAGNQFVGLFRVGADQDAALATSGDGHIAAYEEGQASKHLFLGEVLFSNHQFPDAVGQILIVRHGSYSKWGATEGGDQRLLDDIFGEPVDIDWVGQGACSTGRGPCPPAWPPTVRSPLCCRLCPVTWSRDRPPPTGAAW